MFMQKPVIDLSKLEGEALEYAKQIVKKNGEVYLSKPKKASGNAKYVWRMVMFFIGNRPQHHCMPVCADFDIEERDYHKRLEISKHLDLIVDSIVKTVPIEKQNGTLRWAKAFGVVQ